MHNTVAHTHGLILPSFTALTTIFRHSVMSWYEVTPMRKKKCNSFSYSEIVLLCVWSFAMLIFTPPHLLPQLFSKIQVSSLNYHRAENCSSVCLSFLFLLQKIKGIVHPLIKILSLFSHWCRSDTWLSFFSGTHKENFWTIIGLHFNIMKVNDWVLSKSY